MAEISNVQPSLPIKPINDQQRQQERQEGKKKKNENKQLPETKQGDNPASSEHGHIDEYV